MNGCIFELLCCKMNQYACFQAACHEQALVCGNGHKEWGFLQCSAGFAVPEQSLLQSPRGPQKGHEGGRGGLTAVLFCAADVDDSSDEACVCVLLSAYELNNRAVPACRVEEEAAWGSW